MPSLDQLLPAAAAVVLFLALLVRHCASVYRAREACKEKQRTVNEPGEIVVGLACREVPYLHRIGVEFSLFRTYAIPRISKLLASTGRFEKKANIRVDETDLLLREVVENGGVQTERGRIAIQRVNAIHALYQGSILNEDMQYVLSVIIVTTPRFLNHYAPRKLMQCELEGMYENWAHMGRALGIEDIPPDFAACEKFVEEYETKYMEFSKDNKTVVDGTVDLMATLYPTCMHGMVRMSVSALCDDRLRKATGLPEPFLGLQAFLVITLRFRAWFLNYFVHPNSEIQRRTPVEKTARGGTRFCPMFHVYDVTHPDYVTEELGTAPSGQLLDATGKRLWR